MIIQLVNYLGGISMNKIFKIVWSEAVGAFVVASELAKGHTKSTTVKKTATGLKILFRLTALAVAVWGSAGTAWAAIPEKTPTGGAVFAIGTGTTSANGTGALSLGHNAQAKNNGALAIGPNSGASPTIANSNNSIAIGVNLQSNGQKAIGIGADTNVNGTSAIAIGNNDSGRITNQGVSGDGAIGVGSNLTVRGNNAIAMGTEAQAKAISAVAVGADTQATGVEAVAIGKGAASTASKALAFGANAEAAGVGAIAIGKSTQAKGEASIVIGGDDHLYGEIKATSRQGIAIGVAAEATGATQAVAIGPDAIASGTQSTSIGNNTRAIGDSSIAIGGDDWDEAKKSVNTQYKKLTGSDMSDGYQNTEAATAAVAVGVKTQATGALSTAFGPGARATEVGASAFGVGAEANKGKAVAIGAGSRTSTNAAAVTSATVNGVTYSGFAGATQITDGSQVSIGTAGYERQIKHVAPGEISATSTDAINGSQLYQVAAQAANPLKFDGDSGTTVERKLGNTLNVKGGVTGALTDNNIGVVADNNSNTLRLKLAQNVNLGDAGSLRTGDTIVNNDGVAITGGPSITKAGISASNKPITNVASGGTTDSNAANIGDVKKAAAAAKTEVQGGTNVASVTKTDSPTDGHTVYTVNAKGAAVALDSSVDGLKLTSSENPTTNVTTYKLDLADKTKTSLAKADSALQNIGVQVNGTDAKTLNQTNSTLNFVNGTGTTAENKNGDIAFNVNKANLSVNGGTVSADKNGDEFATAKSVADAINKAVTDSEKTSVVAAGDNTHVASAVSGNQTTYTVHADKTTVSAKTGGKLNVTSVQTANGNQTKTTNYELDLTDAAKAEIAKGVEAKTAVDTQGIGFAADSGSPVTKKLGDSLNIKGDNKNITTKINDGNVQVTLNDDISVQNVNAAASVITPKVVAGDSTLTSDGLNITGGPSITKTGISAGNKPITNVASGGTTDSNAANIGDVKKAAAAAKTVVKQGANTTVSSATDAATGATEYTVNAEKSVVQGSSDVTVNAVTNGLTTTYTADLSTTAKASLAKADTAVQKVVSSNPNLTASKTGDTVTLDFSQTPSFSSVTAGNSVLTTDGLKITNGTNSVSLTGAGLSNGGNKITNIADGAADTDAASYKQVKAAKTEVQAGTNVASVTKTDNPTDGHAVYTVNAKGAAVALDSSVDGLKLTSSEDTTTNVTTYKLDLADKTKTSLAKADSALQNIGVQVNGADAKTLTKDDSTLNFVNGTGTTAENKGGTVAFNVNKSTLTAGTDGTVNAGKAGDAFATAADVAQAINEAVANSEKTSVVEKGDNTHVAVAEVGNKTTYTVHADNTTVSVKDGGKLKLESSEKANANQTKTTNYELDLSDDAKAEIKKGVDAKNIVDNKGITFNGDSGSPVTKKLDETLVIKGDNKNVVTEAGTDGIKVKLKDDITLTSVTADTLKAGDSILTSAGLTTPKVTAGNSVLMTDGLKIGDDSSPNQVSLTTAGLNNGGNKITKVAEGTLTVDSTDAVNGAQLYKVDQKANTNAENIAKGINVGGTTGSKKYALGDTVNIKGDNNIVSDTVEGGVQLKLADTVKIGQDSGKPVSIDGVNGTVSGLSNTTLGSTPLAGSNKAATEAQLDATQVNLATILGGNAANDKGNVTTNNIGGTGKDNVHEAIAAVKETADKGWNLKANDESDSEKIAAGDTVTVKQGKNIRVKRSGKDLTVETSEDVEFAHVKADSVEATSVVAESVIAGNSVLTTDGLKIGADSSSNQVSLTTAGLNNGGNKIANVAKGTAATDAVNVAQLNEQLAATEKTTTVVAGKNVTVSEKVDGNNTEYTVNADKTTLSQAANGAVKVSEGAKDADGVTDYALDLTDEAKADIAKGVAAKDAVDNKGLTFAADNGTTGAKKLGDSLSVKGDGNILTRADENGIGFSLADKITVGKAGNGNKPLVIDGTAGLISGLSNTTLGGADFATKGQAASEEQLNAAQANLANLLGGNAANDKGNVTTTDIGGTGKDNVHDAIAAVKATADKGWNLNANDETSSEKIGAGDTVTFKEGKNVKVSRNGKNITVATSDDVSFDKVTVGGSVLTDNGLTVGNGKAGKPVSLTKDGLNNGGNKVTDIAAGEADTDAVNVAQLKAAAAKATSKVDSGNDNIVVTPEQNADGSTTYKVATAPNLKADSFTAGDTVVNNDGVKVGDKVALGKDGLKAGDVNITTDGINAGNKAISNVAAGVKDTDAVNVAQLKAAAAKATSKVESGNDNIVVTPEQNADGSTTYKVATAPNLKADSFTAGDTVVNNDGVKVGDKVALGKDGLKAGDVNITADGINAGNKAISNVAEGKKDTDAVNVGQLNRLTAAAKTEVEAGTNIASVSSKQGANGQTVYTVNADGASVSAGSDNIVVTKGNKDANNVTDYAVDLSKAVKADIAKGVAAKDAVDNKGISFAGDSGTTVANKLGDTVAVKGDANITTTAGANGIQVGLNKDLKVDSVKAGDTVVNNNGVNVGDKVALGKDGLKAGDVNITAEGINAGGKKVTNVAAGTVAAGSTDAVNGGQLHQVYELIGSNGGNVNTAPPSVEADGKAGLGNIKNITLVDNSNNPNVTNVTNETKIAQSNGYSLVTYNVEDQGMYVTNNVIEAVGRMNEQGIKFFHTNDGEVNPDVQARNSEDSSASGAYATAVGFQAASKGTNAIAIGKGAKANAENTIAIGTGNIVSGKNSGAIGDPTVVSGNSSYSIGNNNNVSADNAYALGSNIKATVNDSVYLGDRAQTQGIHTADAAKGEAYTYGGLNDKAVAGKAGSAAAANKVAGVVTVGNGTDETRQVQGVAAGVVSADSTDAINGSQLYYTNQAIANVATQATAAKTEVTAGKNVVVNQTTGNSGQTVYNVATADKLDVASVTAGGVTVNAQGVSIAAPTAHNPANTVSLSPIGLNNGGQRITNVAPAKEGTDAVNLNQLAGVGNALQNNIERVGKKAYAGVAGAIAQGSIPQVTRPGATGIGVGSGYYGGQSAMAIGVSAMSDGGNWVVKGNFSANTDGHVGVGAGALYQW